MIQSCLQLCTDTFFFRFFSFLGGFLGGTSGTRTCLPMQEMEEMQVWSLGGEHPLEEGMASPSSTLAWRSSWTEEPGGLQSMGSQELDTTKPPPPPPPPEALPLPWGFKDHQS